MLRPVPERPISSPELPWVTTLEDLQRSQPLDVSLPSSWADCQREKATFSFYLRKRFLVYEGLTAGGGELDCFGARECGQPVRFCSPSFPYLNDQQLAFTFIGLLRTETGQQDDTCHSA